MKSSRALFRVPRSFVSRTPEPVTLGFGDLSAYLLDCGVHVSRRSDLEIWLRGSWRVADHCVGRRLLSLLFPRSGPASVRRIRTQTARAANSLQKRGKCRNCGCSARDRADREFAARVWRWRQAMKRHLLVFDDGSGSDLDLRGFVDSLDAGAAMYTLDGHVCFLTTTLTASEVTDRFLKLAGSRLFFVADVTSSECSGRMLGAFFDFMKAPALQSAAE